MVDSQVHLASPGEERWQSPPEEGLTRQQRRDRRLGGHARPDETQLLDEMDAAGVDAAVLVPLAATMGDPEDRHEPCVQAARRHPNRFAVVGRIDPMAPEQADILDAWQDRPEVVGVRVAMRSDQIGGDADETYRRAGWLWAALEERGIPLMINASGTLTQLAGVAASHPQLRIAVDHLGFVGMDSEHLYDRIGPRLGPLIGLAEYDNVSVKASGLPAVISEPYPFPHLRDDMKEVVAAFASRRVFWGSNLSRLPCPYRQVVDFFRTRLDFLEDGETADILGGSLIQWLAWPRLGEAAS